MTEYRIFETDQFQKDLAGIARSGRSKVGARFRQSVYPQLRSEPHFGPNVRKLKGYSPETWRYRIGNWRFFYEIDDDEHIVYLLAASHRGSAY